jgi:superfamily II DNA/RNA helicase
MKAIISELPNLKKRILTSATQGVKIPGFVGLNRPSMVNYLNEETPSNLSIKTVISPTENKLKTLLDVLQHIGSGQGIVFCNLRDSISEVGNYLKRNNVSYTCFYGAMEQKDREHALIKFRNGSAQLLIATDLAARGIDVPEIKFIIHYELPRHEHEFIHRNGRTARVNASGTAYVLKAHGFSLPEYIVNTSSTSVIKKTKIKAPFWETLFITGGRKDKISKGDIAGLFFKEGGLNKDQLGHIELKSDCAYVAVPLKLAEKLVENLNNSRLKKKKVRITVLES